MPKNFPAVEIFNAMDDRFITIAHEKTTEKRKVVVTVELLRTGRNLTRA